MSDLVENLSQKDTFQGGYIPFFQLVLSITILFNFFDPAS